MPRSSRPLTIHPIVLREVEVTRVVDVTPNLRRLTLTGADLAAGSMGDGFHRPNFSSTGFDDHVKFVIPPGQGDLPRIGTQEEKRFAWNPEVLEFTRDYTVRSWDPDALSFDIEVVRHDHGLASDWAYRATGGERLHVAGPKSCAEANLNVDWHLLVGDVTALPAIARWLEEAPADTHGHVIVEVPTADDQQDLVKPAQVTIEWLVRGDIPAGLSRQLDRAVRKFVPPAGRGFAWVAGEAMTIAPLRRYFRDTLGMSKEDVEVIGHWRLPPVRTTDTDDAPRDNAERLAPVPTADESAEDVEHEVHEMTELAPPIVTRVAVTLGINPAVASGADTIDALAEVTGVTTNRLVPLLDAMIALGLLERHGQQYRNTARGAVLMEDHALDELDLDNPANREALALIDLLDVLRTGDPSSRCGTRSAVQRRHQVPGLQSADDARAAEELQYSVQALAALPDVANAQTLAVAGDAAGFVASAIAAGRTVHLPGIDATTWPAQDCAVLISALEVRSDEDAEQMLRQGFAAGPTLVICERVADGAADDDHIAEHALTSLVLTGFPVRTRDEIEALVRRAGARSVERVVLGWGFDELSRILIARV